MLTVHEDYYEEKPDWNLVKLLPSDLRIEKTKACKVTQPRLVGDIGIRAFFNLYSRAKQLIQQETFDFLYIPIPSFYCALLGRWLHNSTGIKYGIDYIDPWVHQFPGSERIFSRHWFSTKIASLLEPIAVRKASMITGVAEGYYRPMLERNPHLFKQSITGAMPYGGEKKDHEILESLDSGPRLFKANDKLKFVYAGAMLPKAYLPLEEIFKVISKHSPAFENVEFHFIGTGKTANDTEGFNIKAFAKKYGLWQKVIFEYPQRIPYLDVLTHLKAADAVFILGSTEPHYTPSKIYQGVLSEKPLFAILHEASTAVSIIRESEAGIVLTFDGEKGIDSIAENLLNSFEQFKAFHAGFLPEQVKTVVFEAYSARNVTRMLADLLNKAIQNKT